MFQKITVLITCLILLISLNHCTTIKQPINSPIISSNILQEGLLNGAGEEGFSQNVMRITSLTHWNEISEALSAINPFESKFDAHQIDFEKTNLYLFTDKVRSTAGYQLSISNGIMHDNIFEFNIGITRPVGNVAEVITQPLLIFTTEKTKDEQRFKFNEL